MKKFFVMAALVGVALTSCMKNEVYVPTCDAPISFEVANYEAQTRAGAFEGTSFGVNAWSYNGTAAHELMVNEVVSKSNDGTKWTTETPYYWPYTGTVDFIAYYPTDVKPTINYNYAGGDTYTYPTYTVGSVDLMYADKAIRFNKNNTAAGNDTELDYTTGDYGFEGVPTLFRHALAKVNFNVQNASPVDANNSAYEYEIIVNSITLNVYNTGTVTLTNAVTANNATATRGSWSVDGNVWTTSGNLATLTWEEEDDAITVLADAVAVPYATRTQYVLPQTLKADTQKITVDYDVIQYHTDAKTKTKTQIGRNNYSVTNNLIDLNLTSWEMNKNITYTISISAQRNQIFFAPAVQDWTDDADGNGITIQ